MVNDGDRIVLAEHGLESPSGLTITTAGAVQVAEFVRAEHAQPIARGNRRTSISFRVTRQHRDALDAQRFLVDHRLGMIWDGLLILEFRGPVGQRVERYLRDAVVESADGNHIGATTITQYQITGGALADRRASAGSNAPLAP